MGSFTPDVPQPWIETPLIYSAPLSRSAGCNVFLKLENLQPSGSFKSRGIGNMMIRAVEAAPRDKEVHFYCSSEGNAGLACATTAAAIGRKATIVVPRTAKPFVLAKLRDLDAEIVQVGGSWNEADAHLREVLLVNHDPSGLAVYVPPFNHADIWEGASTLVDEVVRQMKAQRGDGVPIDGIVCNVGGGGLLNGVMEGVERHKAQLGRRTADSEQRTTPKVLAMETEGADCLNKSVQAGDMVTLPAITSIALSLGAKRVSEKSWEWAQRAGEDLTSATVPDAEAAMACVKFLDDSRILVEVACGATLATVYNGGLRKYLGKELNDDQWAQRNVVMVVCGGSNTNLQTVYGYRETYGKSVSF
ncbi:tryptophan synthase beta subunit-like PLP-dependent enzyme [Podospora didyma]|uniref:L-serine ammonia-lyase n=1 Tax=Podospora didyma TaxID=330526 RepID=A0AAE0KK86_9PEZI|nr:tryptophan synthase beta subunit-like PLP-dependent enzyme [Podospora didyma]